MKDTARQIGRLFTIENPSIICDIETKTEMPHHSAENSVEVYPGNFDEHKHELLKYRIEKRNAHLPSEHILPTAYEIKQELKFIEKHIKDYESEPEQINNWLRYYEPKNYWVLLEMYREYLLEQLKETKNERHESGSAYEYKKNPDSNIFKSDYAYTLFTLMHKQRPSNDNPKAFYSAMFTLMKADKLINESIEPHVFKNFVIKYSNRDVYLEKIEGNHSYSTKNENIYIKEKQNLRKP